jgi:hypothetical protein
LNLKIGARTARGVGGMGAALIDRLRIAAHEEECGSARNESAE